MSEQKDFWDKLSSVTPLLIGILVTGVGAIFTQIYNFQQLQLNQILALEKLRPLLVSDKPEDREFGYASFAALGYEETAIRIIQIKRDQSGREVLVQLEKTGDKNVRSNASEALKTLNEAEKLISKLEYGSTEGLLSWMQRGAVVASEYGVNTKLGVALIADTVVQSGTNRAKLLAESTSQKINGSPKDRVSEETWIREYFDQRKAWLASRNIPGLNRRMEEFSRLIDSGDWELREYAD